MAESEGTSRLPEILPVRAFFEALVDGCNAVAETDEDAARMLLTGIARALDKQADAIRGALVADSDALVDLGLKPFSVASVRGGSLALFRPVGASQVEAS
ncbi:hypothetical protein ACFXKC_40720 [Streptomyces sp. NPDC059340]|uniref:hypothetical protein n=1 Tax=Streptomyces sp. NPDC059340 TaxID=3346806 RepID=UPI0036AB851D